MKRGKYIMIEGGEGCGKDTHADLLMQYLQEEGYNVILTREPGGTDEAQKIRELLAKKGNDLSPIEELHLFMAARGSNYRKIVVPNLEKGNIIIKTRGWPSTYSYQGYAGGLNLDLIKDFNERVTLGIKPDLLIMLDVPAEKGLKKELDAGRFAAKGLEYHQKVHEGYLKVAKNNPDISVVIPYVEEGVGEMQKQIRNHVMKLFS
ncbi:MAG: dTMP kinase [archaeon]